MWRRAAILTGVLAGTLVVGTSAAVSERLSRERSTDLRVHLTSNRGHPTVALTFRCDRLDGSTDAHSRVCRELYRDPLGYFSDYTPMCYGPAPKYEMEITGRFRGIRVHLRQDGACGPDGVKAWYRLLRDVDLGPWRPQGSPGVDVRWGGVAVDP